VFQLPRGMTDAFVNKDYGTKGKFLIIKFNLASPRKSRFRISIIVNRWHAV
jgi:hypothetical protein